MEFFRFEVSRVFQVSQGLDWITQIAANDYRFSFK